MTATETPNKRRISEVGIQPFFINQEQFANSKKDIERQIQLANSLRRAWDKTNPSNQVKSLSDLQNIAKNPGERYARLVAGTENRIGVFANMVEKTKEIKVEFPKGFEEISSLASKVDTDINWRFLDFQDGEIVINPFFYQRHVNRTIWFAITPAQTRRLEAALAMKKQIEELDIILQDEFAEAGITDRAFKLQVADKAHIGPIPMPLRYKFDGTQKHVEINEQWVVFGSAKQFDGLRTGSTEDRYRIGLVEGMPFLFGESDKKTGAKMFRQEYHFHQGHLTPIK